MTNMWDQIDENKVTGEYVQSSNFDPMPEGTRVLATLEEIKLDSFGGSDHEHINIKWAVDAPEEYNKRKFFQTIYINGSDPTGQYYDASKHKKNVDDANIMLANIDKNAGGKMRAGRLDPTDDNLKNCLIGAQMMVTLGITKNGKQTVRGVSQNDRLVVETKPKVNPVAKTPANQVDDSYIDDDIPF